MLLDFLRLLFIPLLRLRLDLLFLRLDLDLLFLRLDLDLLFLRLDLDLLFLRLDLLVLDLDFLLLDLDLLFLRLLLVSLLRLDLAPDSSLRHTFTPFELGAVTTYRVLEWLC